MIGEKILERKNASIVEVKKLLQTRKKEKELNYEQETSYKYAKTFSKLTLKQSEKVYKELMNLEGMTDRLAKKIIDIMPKEIEVMKLLPLKDEEIKEATLEKSMEIIKKY